MTRRILDLGSNIDVTAIAQPTSGEAVSSRLSATHGAAGPQAHCCKLRNLSGGQIVSTPGRPLRSGRMIVDCSIHIPHNRQSLIAKGTSMIVEQRGGLLHGLSSRMIARIAGAFYLINIATALVAFSGKGRSPLVVASGLTATASYIAVTILLYYLFTPVNARVSLIAGLFSLAGCIVGVLSPLHLVPFHIHSLVLFGIYCLLIGFMIIRSRFLPRILGALMMAAGLVWLTFLSRPLAASLSPYHYITGGIGEGILTLWLLFVGVDAAKWNEQASTATTVAR